MKWFYNLKIRSKLIISFIILTLLSGIIGIIGLSSINSINSGSRDMYFKNFLPSKDLLTVQTSLEEVRALHVLAIYEKNPAALQNKLDEINALIDNNNMLLENYKATIADDQDQTLYDAVIASLDNYRTLRNASLELVKNGQYDQALAELGNVSAAREKADADLKKLVEYNISLADQTVKNNADNYNRQTILLTALIIVCVLAAYRWVSLSQALSANQLIKWYRLPKSLQSEM
jgi:methyl-accepting chemotaxis protein